MLLFYVGLLFKKIIFNSDIYCYIIFIGLFSSITIDKLIMWIENVSVRLTKPIIVHKYKYLILVILIPIKIIGQ